MSLAHTSTGHRKAQQLLNSLPSHSVVLDCHGRAYQHGGINIPYWYEAWGDGAPLSSYELAYKHPITVMKPVKGHP